MLWPDDEGEESSPLERHCVVEAVRQQRAIARHVHPVEHHAVVDQRKRRRVLSRGIFPKYRIRDVISLPEM